MDRQTYNKNHRRGVHIITKDKRMYKTYYNHSHGKISYKNNRYTHTKSRKSKSLIKYPNRFPINNRAHNGRLNPLENSHPAASNKVPFLACMKSPTNIRAK